MQDDVEKIAAIFCLSHGSGLCARRCNACIDDARAAMAATLELTAAALREMSQDPMHALEEDVGLKCAANWLTRRAQEIADVC